MADAHEWDGEGPPPLRLYSADGRSYWTAERLPWVEDHRLPDGVEGDTVVFYPDVGVELPLWDDGGPLVDDPAWLSEHLGLDAALVARLRAWGVAYDQPGSWQGSRDEWEAEGRRLVEEVRTHLPEGLTLGDGWHRDG